MSQAFHEVKDKSVTGSHHNTEGISQQEKNNKGDFFNY